MHPGGKDIRHILQTSKPYAITTFCNATETFLETNHPDYTKIKLRKSCISSFSLSPVAKP